MTKTDIHHHQRIIFVHKHPTSARTRFLRFKENSVCGFSPLPALSQLINAGTELTRPIVESHPAALLSDAAVRMALPQASMELEPEYSLWVDAPKGAIHILLARLTDIDPPFEAAQSIGATFIDLTQARDLPEIELLLLRRAYEVLLGG